MQKQILERFISKYSLGGLIEMVQWKSDGQKVWIDIGTTDNKIVAQVSCTDIKLPAGEYCIYETSQLRSLLGILSDEVTLAVKSVKGVPAAFTFSDPNTVVDFALADPITMPQKTAQLRTEHFTPDMWAVHFTIDPQFATAFVRAKGALNVEDFTVKAKKNTTIILGFAEYGNTTRVTLQPQNDVVEREVEPVKFSANCMRELLMANKEAPASIRVSDYGLLHASFELEGFTANYYLSALND